MRRKKEGRVEKEEEKGRDGTSTWRRFYTCHSFATSSATINISDKISATDIFLFLELKQRRLCLF